MRLKSYLTEGRSVQVDEAEALAWMHKHYDPSNTPIYRGVENLRRDKCYIVEPAKHERTSANTENYYTLIIDNSKRWSKYPKRSRSIICATNTSIADDYGYIFRIIPESNARVGICGNCDFWASFPNLGGYSMADLNRVLEDLWCIVKGNDIYPDGYHEIVELFYSVDNHIHAVYDESLDYNRDEFPDESENTLEDMSRESTIDYFLSSDDVWVGGKNLRQKIIEAVLLHDVSSKEFVDELLDPEDNGFELDRAGSLRTDDYNEVWTDGKSLMVPEEMFERMINIQ